ncbi:S1C family serine protease [Deinococcus geothermalis]|uniref:Peptidase S1 and S6, chymotrypsin/Hap n=1 Tax=Deinococcus geothermalis (strain DSM 11300 / CIP 105573 / AG-3a) TaxID=319795 RepID=Q1J0Y0_DEIGD|nr:trypsin-like peptidase domain-containing protein [Deinococcus geothermalis]ABF44854.1 peptidase S1 and S6, chymotrypsin/Hap [Deinococcus geothermalis DSM 11300]
MRRPMLAAILVLVGLGLGATLLRDQVPISDAQKSPAATTAPTAGTEAGARLQNEQNTIDIVSRYEPGLVYISTEQQVVQQDPLGWMLGGQDETQVVQGVGSGFFVNEQGDILTNYHVVAGENGQGPASSIRVRVMNREQSVPARVIGLAPQYDLALIRAEGLDKSLIRPIPLGDSDTLKAGQKAIAMGAPFGLDFSVTEGIVSSTARQIPIGFSATGEGITQKAIQTDAAINPGNSGGPLLDSSGRVIGINTQILSPAGAATGVGQNAGVGFAIPINAAKNLLPRLQQAKGGIVTAPRLGITVGLVVQGPGQLLPVGLSALSSQGKRELGLPETGLVVGQVEPNTPAAKSGLRGGTRTQTFRGGQIVVGGDVITAADGKPVDGIEDLQAVLIDKQPGDSVTLRVVRGKQTRDVKVTLDNSSFE